MKWWLPGLQEIGAGGMALESAGRLLGGAARESCLYPAGGTGIEAGMLVVWWKRDKRVGIRFDLRDAQLPFHPAVGRRADQAG